MATSHPNDNYRIWYTALIAVLVLLILLFQRFTHLFS